MGYFLLIGTNSSLNSSFGACKEIVSAISVTLLSSSILGTMPEVLKVTFLLDKP